MDGILIIDKPYGMTSHDVVNWLRKKYKQKKFGHTGTLDPNATGVLVVLCGKSCKLLQFLSDTDKEYIGQIEFGKSTSTDDIWGEVEAEKEMNVSIDDEMKTKMVSLMKKIGGLDLDLGKIQNQAQNVYDKIKDMGINLDDAKGIWAKICDFFVMIGKAIADFFSNLF